MVPPVKTQTGPRINRAIRAPEVRVIDEEGNQLGVLPLGEALELAQSRDLDLVEVAANAVPPVCKLVDFGRFKYEQTKRERDAKKHQHVTEMKELRLRPKTDPHDLEVRAKAARKFLEEGHKVRLLVRFRGRETQHPDIARSQIDHIARAVSDIGVVEFGPAMEGRAMFAIIVRGSGAKQQQPPRPPEAGRPVAPAPRPPLQQPVGAPAVATAQRPAAAPPAEPAVVTPPPAAAPASDGAQSEPADDIPVSE